MHILGAKHTLCHNALQLCCKYHVATPSEQRLFVGQILWLWAPQPKSDWATGESVSWIFQIRAVSSRGPTDNPRLSWQPSVAIRQVISDFPSDAKIECNESVQLSSRSTKSFDAIRVHKYSILLLSSPVAQSDSGNLAKVHPVVTYLFWIFCFQFYNLLGTPRDA